MAWSLSPIQWASMGYSTMARVDSALTPMTVKSVARSFMGSAGKTVEIAMAADAPQIATEPPVSTPKEGLNPAMRANSKPTAMVAATDPTTSKTGNQPRAAICPSVMRKPNSATPTRKRCLAAISMPGMHGPPCERKFMDMPSSSANSMTGAP